MELEVSWEETAEEQLDQNLHFLLTSFGSGAATSLMNAIQKAVEQLSRYPESGRAVPIDLDPPIRYVSVRQSHFLYYWFDQRTLYIVGLYGTKQIVDNPYR